MCLNLGDVRSHQSLIMHCKKLGGKGIEEIIYRNIVDYTHVLYRILREGG